MSTQEVVTALEAASAAVHAELVDAGILTETWDELDGAALAAVISGTVHALAAAAAEQTVRPAEDLMTRMGQPWPAPILAGAEQLCQALAKAGIVSPWQTLPERTVDVLCAAVHYAVNMVMAAD